MNEPPAPGTAEMNDAPNRPDNELTRAARELVRLNDRVEAMRAVLVGLLQDVIRADSRLEHGQAAQLVEANEHLVLSALGALKDAETAHGELDEVSRVSATDPLTGLPNRTVLLDRLENAISNAKRHGKRVGLLFLDLNDFKQINDSFGHAAGDRALQLVAGCLASLVRETDTVSRHGGDEFLIILAEMVQPDDAALVAEKMNAALGAYSRIDDHVVSLRASIGISVYPEDGEDAKTLIDRADMAMYLAKKQPLGGFAFHATHPPGRASLPAPAIQSQRRRLTHYELTMAEYEQRQQLLREANEELVLAALGAQERLAAAEEARSKAH